MPGLVMQTGRRGLRELAYLSIREAICTLQIAPGDRITEESLSGELGVSRPILREALQRLQFDQLIERLDNGRLRVRPITVADTEHLYAVRSALEQLTMREATARVTATDLAALAGMVDTMRAAQRAGEHAAMVAAGGEFHQRLAQVAANPVNDHLMDQIRTRLDRLRNVSVKLEARPHESVSEHAAILDGLKTGDPEIAAGAMDCHIESGRTAAIKVTQQFVDAESGPS